MRKLVFLVHTSVDGLIEGPGGAFDWPVMGPELSAYVHELDAGVDTFVYGRVVWEMMAGFWPRAEELSADPHVLRFAPVWRRTPKVVFSRTLAEPADPGVRVVRGDPAAGMKALKAAEGKDLLLTGGTELASTLAGAGLIDEFHVAVHPVVLGGGKRLFLGVSERFGLGLAGARTCDGRVVVMRYVRA